MNKDRIEGKAKEVGGDVEQRVGRATGDDRMEARGADRQLEGKGQGFWGKVKGWLKM